MSLINRKFFVFFLSLFFLFSTPSFSQEGEDWKVQREMQRLVSYLDRAPKEWQIPFDMQKKLENIILFGSESDKNRIIKALIDRSKKYQFKTGTISNFLQNVLFFENNTEEPNRDMYSILYIERIGKTEQMLFSKPLNFPASKSYSSVLDENNLPVSIDRISLFEKSLEYIFEKFECSISGKYSVSLFLDSKKKKNYDGIKTFFDKKTPEEGILAVSNSIKKVIKNYERCNFSVNVNIYLDIKQGLLKEKIGNVKNFTFNFYIFNEKKIEEVLRNPNFSFANFYKFLEAGPSFEDKQKELDFCLSKEIPFEKKRIYFSSLDLKDKVDLLSRLLKRSEKSYQEYLNNKKIIVFLSIYITRDIREYSFKGKQLPFISKINLNSFFDFIIFEYFLKKEKYSYYNDYKLEDIDRFRFSYLCRLSFLSSLISYSQGGLKKEVNEKIFSYVLEKKESEIIEFFDQFSLEERTDSKTKKFIQNFLRKYTKENRPNCLSFLKNKGFFDPIEEYLSGERIKSLISKMSNKNSAVLYVSIINYIKDTGKPNNSIEVINNIKIYEEIIKKTPIDTITEIISRYIKPKFNNEINVLDFLNNKDIEVLKDKNNIKKVLFYLFDYYLFGRSFERGRFFVFLKKNYTSGFLRDFILTKIHESISTKHIYEAFSYIEKMKIFFDHDKELSVNFYDAYFKFKSSEKKLYEKIDALVDENKDGPRVLSDDIHVEKILKHVIFYDYFLYKLKGKDVNRYVLGFMLKVYFSSSEEDKKKLSSLFNTALKKEDGKNTIKSNLNFKEQLNQISLEKSPLLCASLVNNKQNKDLIVIKEHELHLDFFGFFVFSNCLEEKKKKELVSQIEENFFKLNLKDKLNFLNTIFVLSSSKNREYFWFFGDSKKILSFVISKKIKEWSDKFYISPKKRGTHVSDEDLRYNILSFWSEEKIKSFLSDRLSKNEDKIYLYSSILQNEGKREEFYEILKEIPFDFLEYVFLKSRNLFDSFNMLLLGFICKSKINSIESNRLKFFSMILDYFFSRNYLYLESVDVFFEAFKRRTTQNERVSILFKKIKQETSGLSLSSVFENLESFRDFLKKDKELSNNFSLAYSKFKSEKKDFLIKSIDQLTSFDRDNLERRLIFVEFVFDDYIFYKIKELKKMDYKTIIWMHSLYKNAPEELKKKMSALFYNVLLKDKKNKVNNGLNFEEQLKEISFENSPEICRALSRNENNKKFTFLKEKIPTDLFGFSLLANCLEKKNLEIIKKNLEKVVFLLPLRTRSSFLNNLVFGSITGSSEKNFLVENNHKLRSLFLSEKTRQWLYAFSFPKDVILSIKDGEFNPVISNKMDFFYETSSIPEQKNLAQLFDFILKENNINVTRLFEKILEEKSSNKNSKICSLLKSKFFGRKIKDFSINYILKKQGFLNLENLISLKKAYLCFSEEEKNKRLKSFEKNFSNLPLDFKFMLLKKIAQAINGGEIANYHLRNKFFTPFFLVALENIQEYIEIYKKAEVPEFRLNFLLRIPSFIDEEVMKNGIITGFSKMKKEEQKDFFEIISKVQKKKGDFKDILTSRLFHPLIPFWIDLIILNKFNNAKDLELFLSFFGIYNPKDKKIFEEKFLKLPMKVRNIFFNFLLKKYFLKEIPWFFSGKLRNFEKISEGFLNYIFSLMVDSMKSIDEIKKNINVIEYFFSLSTLGNNLFNEFFEKNPRILKIFFEDKNTKIYDPEEKKFKISFFLRGKNAIMKYILQELKQGKVDSLLNYNFFKFYEKFSRQEKLFFYEQILALIKKYPLGLKRKIYKKIDTFQRESYIDVSRKLIESILFELSKEVYSLSLLNKKDFCIQNKDLVTLIEKIRNTDLETEWVFGEATKKESMVFDVVSKCLSDKYRNITSNILEFPDKTFKFKNIEAFSLKSLREINLDQLPTSSLEKLYIPKVESIKGNFKKLTNIVVLQVSYKILPEILKNLSSPSFSNTGILKKIQINVPYNLPEREREKIEEKALQSCLLFKKLKHSTITCSIL